MWRFASQFEHLQSQPNSEQNPYKISYYLAEAEAEVTLKELKKALSAKGFEIKLIYSAGQDLDLLPKNGDKGLAVQFFASQMEYRSQTNYCLW